MNTELNPLLPVLVTKHNGCGYIAAGCTVHAIPLEIADALIARDAAVAELIEAAKVFANDDRQRAWHPAYRPQMDALHAALARVGGAS